MAPPPAQSQPGVTGDDALGRALAGLPHPEVLLEGLFRHSPVPYLLLDAQGHPLAHNPAYQDMFGAVPPPDYSVLRDEVLAGLGLRDCVQRAYRGEVVVTPTFWYDPRQLGHIRVTHAQRVAISCTLLPLHGRPGQLTHVAVLYRDLTAELEARAAGDARQAAALGREHQARTEAQRTEARMRAITQNTTLGLFMMDARQHCVFMNPAAERITGFTLAEVQGRPLHDFIHHTRPDGTPFPMEECPIDRALPTRVQEQGQDLFVRKDGSFYPVAFTASPILENGAPVGTVIELRDTTEDLRRQAERERLLAELQQAVRVREEFLSIASHELKTPLTPLSLKLQALCRALESEPASDFTALVRSYVETGRKQVQRLSTLVGGLLDVSRIQAGRLQLELEEMDLRALVLEVVGRFEEQARRAGSALSVSADAPLTGVWDHTRMEQVVTNLLDNALKYGCGHPIELALSLQEGRALLTLTDRGIGIPPESLSRIFGRFERAVSERNYGGLGLGLFISRQLVEAHGGSLHAASEPGVRTTFTVELPLRPPGPAASAGGRR